MQGSPVTTSTQLQGPPKGESYWDLVLRQFRRNRLAVISFFFVLALFSIAIGAPFLANNKPLVLQGVYRDAYRDRLQEWKLAGHGEMIVALQEASENDASGASDGQGRDVEARLQTIRNQLGYLASQLAEVEAQRLLGYLEEYEQAVQAALAGDRAAYSEQLLRLEQNYQEIARQYDPEAVTFEQKLYWPILSSLTAIDVFFLTLAVALLLLPLTKRALPPDLRDAWRTAAILAFLPAVVLAGFWAMRPSVLETIDYKQQLREGGIESTLALFPPVPYGINEDHLEDKYQKPSSRYWMGTDGNGRDLLTRMIWGSRISLSVGFVAVGIYVVIGVFIGSLAGYFRGWVDIGLSRVIEIVICFPSFFLILAVLAFLQPSMWNIMVVIGITGWTTEARLVRGEFLRLADQEFVLAAKGLGVSNARVIFRHILPNGLAPVLVAASFGVASAILIESSLSFLGFGISIPIPSWGGILNEARENFRYWWITIFPGLAIFSAVTAYNLVGEGIRDAIDPRLKL